MSEFLGLGVADGESRWIGVRRHQAVLVIAGLGLIGEWVTQVHANSIGLVIGRRAAVRRGPDEGRLTVGERARIAVDFAMRSRWTTLRATMSHRAVTIRARGEATVHGFELQHRGRLDLSGRDRQNAARARGVRRRARGVGSIAALLPARALVTDWRGDAVGRAGGRHAPGELEGERCDGSRSGRYRHRAHRVVVGAVGVRS